jgi:hypothetical protein
LHGIFIVFSLYVLTNLVLFVDHRAQVLRTGQVPAEFAVPKPDEKMADASEEAEKMHKDGQNQEGEDDGQKQDDERNQTRRGM